MIDGLAPAHLFVSGMLHEAGSTICLLSPAEPGFWAHVTTEPEFHDGTPDPLDRWSRRVIGAVAAQSGGRAVFPFDGPPWQPFFRWALASGAFFSSPVQLLVHDDMGLWASIRGAVLLPGLRPLIRRGESPCTDCAAPCMHACPTHALGQDGYALDACHGFLETPDGKDCLSQGCHVRRACPISLRHGRVARQSAWHMRHFHK